MLERPGKKIVPFAPTSKDDITDHDATLDRSGQAIVALIEDASAMAKETCERAMTTAQQLSIKLRAAEDRVVELESELKQYQARAAQAEKWLVRIHAEIQDRFFGSEVAHDSAKKGFQRGTS